MKKIFSIIMIFVLTFFTVNPLPPTLAADQIPAGISDITFDPITNIGFVTVTAHEAGLIFTLQKNFDPKGSVGNAFVSQEINDKHTFKFTEAGSYFVQGNKGTIITRSETFYIAPPILKNIIPGEEPYSVMVKDATAGATLNISNTQINNFKADSIKVDGIGVAIFKKLPAGKDFKITQTVNGAVSELSESITVKPSVVTLKVLSHSGELNQTGTIEVTNTKAGNTLVLYKDGFEDQRKTEIHRDSDAFTGLKSGSYKVFQIENEIESPFTDLIDIDNEEKPKITLVGSPVHNITYPQNYTLDQIGKPGATAEDYDKKPLEVVIESTNIPSLDKDGNHPPGIYEVIYKATSKTGISNTIKRTVTILPQIVTMTPFHTNNPVDKEPQDQRATGDIMVEKVYENATLYLYQDDNPDFVRTIPFTSLKDHMINDVPIGKNYFVIQEVTSLNGSSVKSIGEARVDIKDTTRPILQLNGEESYQLVAGDQYIEHGATATDNNPLSKLIVDIGGDSVDTSIPGEYIVTYDVKDHEPARNAAIQLKRKITVKPPAVIAQGSTAVYGEISVSNIFPGTVNKETSLYLYKLKEDNTEDESFAPVKHIVEGSETTHVFKKYGPGKYFVKQKVNGLLSAESNIVEIVDIDRPHITLNGPDKIELVWDEDKPDYYKKANQMFTDPGATATDYLDVNEELTKKIKRKIMFGKELICDDKVSDKPLCEHVENEFQIRNPGTYTITYSVTAERGTPADNKHRTITVAPPKVSKLSAEVGKSTINVEGVFNYTNAKASVNLYNSYNQLVESKDVSNSPITSFSNVPAGLGYYVTQTVNGLESKSSSPINVSLFENAEETALITSFEFSTIRAYGTIDHELGTIDVVVPKNTNIKSLKASFSATGAVRVGTAIQSSTSPGLNFTNPVIYTAASKDGKQKRIYEVTVTVAKIETNTWTTTINKSVSFSKLGNTIALTADERLKAMEKGVSFVGSDRAIHVPPANVIEANTAALTIKTPATYIANTTNPNQSLEIVQPTEISWGNSSQPFMQPIEIEFPKPKTNQSFARIVRDGNQLFAITQLSETTKDNMVGLATEPGTYALVDNIAKPVIKSAPSNGKTMYQITTTVPGAEIYYTTNSSHIAFDQSARRATLKNYSLVGVPDLSKWNVYKSGDGIPAPSSGEIYAFVKKDQIISPLTDAVTVLPTEWSKDIKEYSTSHVLKITFNTKVDRKALYSGMISVINDSTGKPFDTTLSLSADGKTILVVPDKAYTNGNQYTLHIDRQFKGNTKDKQFLKQPLTQTFVAK